MTANMIDYLLWRGDLPLRDYPFNEVDCAILASISYLPFERIDLAQVHAPLSLGEASRLLLGLPDIGRAVLLPDDVRDKVNTAGLRRSDPEFLDDIFFFAVSAMCCTLMEILRAPERAQTLRERLRERTELLRLGCVKTG